MDERNTKVPVRPEIPVSPPQVLQRARRQGSCEPAPASSSTETTSVIPALLALSCVMVTILLAGVFLASPAATSKAGAPAFTSAELASPELSAGFTRVLASQGRPAAGETGGTAAPGPDYPAEDSTDGEIDPKGPGTDPIDDPAMDLLFEQHAQAVQDILELEDQHAAALKSGSAEEVTQIEHNLQAARDRAALIQNQIDEKSDAGF